jgi:hypothetical protein
LTAVRRIALKVLYWLAVLAVSIVLLFLLLAFFESRDASDVDNGAAPALRL